MEIQKDTREGLGLRKGSAMVFEVENFRDTPKKLRKRINMKKIIEKEYDIP